MASDFFAHIETAIACERLVAATFNIFKGKKLIFESYQGCILFGMNVKTRNYEKLGAWLWIVSTSFFAWLSNSNFLMGYRLEFNDYKGNVLIWRNIFVFRYPYSKSGRKSTKVIKPEAPYNSNQFLLEDHGNIEELDENLKHADKFSTTSAARTRDSSFSVDSDGEFYSSPDDEEEFLIKDFVDQYESVHAERLQTMSKDDLIQEYLVLETKLEILTKRQRKRMQMDDVEAVNKAHRDLQGEVERLTIENEALKRENAALRSKNVSSNSEDSETDSNDSCSSTSSSSSSSTCSSTRQRSPIVDYSKTNGNSTGIETV